MKKIKALIADDEEELRKYLKARLSEVWPDLIICAEARNGREAMEVIAKHQPEIIFLDIRMPGLTGMEVARKIAGTCRVVFVTAYDEYAVEAFEKGAVDYLLKPVTRERLEKTVKRLQEQVATPFKPSAEVAEILERILGQKKGPSFLRWVRVQHKDGVRLFPVEEVCYFQAGDKYTRVITKAGESLIRKTIRELLNELDPDQFWQIHRGTIVNAAAIARVGRSLTGRGELRLKDRPEILTVSHRYLHVFKQM
ncbi:MAG: response regulator transcription factor [Syntrophaceae bacterium]|nr:response regulator transcription factor [Syntrophaceae bacterium]